MRTFIQRTCTVFTAAAILLVLLYYTDQFDNVTSLNGDLSEVLKDEYKTHMDDTSYAVQMAERINEIARVCNNLNSTNLHNMSTYKPKIYFLPEYNLSYCGVGKAGSTFYKYLFSILTETNGDIKPLGTKSRLKIHLDMSKLRVPYAHQNWKYSASLITPSRNPYTRLYSAYIDRVTIPSISPLIREGSKCLFDVTFEDFLIYVVRHTKIGKLDHHWSPIYLICKTCEVNTTYVIKQESFKNDTQYLLGTLKLTRSKRDALNAILKQSQVRWTITGIVKEVMERTRGEFLEPGCIGMYGVAKQLWYAFQVQGYIDANIEFGDMYKGAFDTISVDRFLETILTTIEGYPLSKRERTLQRQRFLVNAYRGVNENVIQDIKQVFRPDFNMFGYSYEPPRL